MKDFQHLKSSEGKYFKHWDGCGVDNDFAGHVIIRIVSIEKILWKRVVSGYRFRTEFEFMTGPSKGDIDIYDLDYNTLTDWIGNRQCFDDFNVAITQI